MDTLIKGCGTAMFTPFRNGEVDVEALIATTGSSDGRVSFFWVDIWVLSLS